MGSACCALENDNGRNRIWFRPSNSTVSVVAAVVAVRYMCTHYRAIAANELRAACATGTSS